jgi:hypothetical protein
MSPRGFHQVRPKQFSSLWYIRCKPCTYLVSRLAIYPTNRNELPLEPGHLGVPLGASKTISDPMVHLAQTVHLSCSDTNTVSERTKTRLHMSHITLEFDRVPPKRFPSISYVWRKQCTYLESRLAPSPNGPKRAST